MTSEVLVWFRKSFASLSVQNRNSDCADMQSVSTTSLLSSLNYRCALISFWMFCYKSRLKKTAQKRKLESNYDVERCLNITSYSRMVSIAFSDSSKPMTLLLDCLHVPTQTMTKVEGKIYSSNRVRLQVSSDNTVKNVRIYKKWSLAM